MSSDEFEPERAMAMEMANMARALTVMAEALTKLADTICREITRVEKDDH